jgi:hydroxymethylglutaryl-CoA reductase
MLMNICHGLLNAIEVSSPEIEDMIDTARSHGAIGAKLTGAGGGGAIIALCPDQKEKVTSGFVDAGYYVLDLQQIILDKNA